MKRDTSVNIRLTSDEKDDLQRRADAAKRTLSDYIRKAGSGLLSRPGAHKKTQRGAWRRSSRESAGSASRLQATL
jgi:hypothetical protein